MRVLFLAVVAILFQVCAFMMGRGIYWLLSPLLPASRTVVMVLMFVVSNVFLSMLFFGQFRLAMGYLAVLWLGVLTMFAVCIVNIITQKLSNGGHQFAWVMRPFALLSFVSLLAVSLYHAYTPTVRHLTVQIDKPMEKSVRLGLASDLHLGRFVGTKQLQQLEQIVRREQIDILVMPGDIMDDNTKVYEADNMQLAFTKVVQATTSGAVASLGNHDLYDIKARQSIADAVRATGVTLLDDKVTTLDVQGVPVSLIGRFDDHAPDRMTTAALFEQLSETARQFPVILLDHRPTQIESNAQLPIDVQVSGHTHNGQVFPANFIVKMLNRVGYGYEKINQTHVIVSSGFGFWGVPFRLGSQSEVWVIELSGKP